MKNVEQVKTGALFSLLGSALISVSTLLITAEALAYEFSADVVAVCDFNGDGYEDIAVGAPNEHLAGLANAGAVRVVYGSRYSVRLAIPASQTWNQNGLGMFGYARKNARFGAALVTADFNQDGLCDLAIGAPGYGLSPAQAGAGMINMLYGSGNGLTIASKPGPVFDAQRFDQDSLNVPEQLEADDRFGAALAAGDFNNDGYADLAVGVPGEDFGTRVDAGFINIFYGSTNGVQTASPPAIGFYQHIVGFPFDNEAGDRYGEALAVGDFNHDGYDDLVVGAPGEDQALANVGRVSVFYGTLEGLDGFISNWLDEEILNPGSYGVNDEFGKSLSSADTNSDGIADLVIGVPGNNAGSGSIYLVPGSIAGLDLVAAEEVDP